MVKIKTAEATGPALDWLVAKAEGYDVAIAEGTGLVIIRRKDVVDYFDPSTNAGWSWPIIERELCVATLARLNSGEWRVQAPYNRTEDREGDYFYGPTALIAAMRCYVTSKLGDEVEIPKELA